MKTILLVLLLTLTAACGCPKNGKDGAAGISGLDGARGAAGADGSNGSNGSDGSNGTNGSNGSNGHNSLVSVLNSAPGCAAGGITLLTGLDVNDSASLDVSEVTASAEVCNGQNGSNGTNGTNGSNGSNGSNGTNGSNGSNGSNGTNGSNGADAPPTPFTPVAIINPCGDAPGVYDEVFLKLQNGTVIASFSQNANGLNTRFSVLTAGTYVTTDGDNCVFTIDNAGNISGENHHY